MDIHIKNDISVRDPSPLPPVAVVSTSTATKGLFMKTTESPDNHSAESETSLNDNSNDVNMKGKEQLRISFAQVVSHAVVLCALQTGRIFR